MKRRSPHRVLPLALAFAIVGGGAALTGTTLAHSGRHDPAVRSGHRHVVEPVRRDYVRGRRGFEAPLRIRNHHRYDRFYLGKFHTHRFGRVKIYEFPVWRHGRKIFVPHAYKRGHLVTSGRWMYDRVIDPVVYRHRDRFRYGYDYRGPRHLPPPPPRRGASVRVGRDWDGDLDVDVIVRGPRFRIRYGD